MVTCLTVFSFNDNCIYWLGLLFLLHSNDEVIPLFLLIPIPDLLEDLMVNVLIQVSILIGFYDIKVYLSRASEFKKPPLPSRVVHFILVVDSTGGFQRKPFSFITQGLSFTTKSQVFLQPTICGPCRSSISISDIRRKDVEFFCRSILTDDTFCRPWPSGLRLFFCGVQLVFRLCREYTTSFSCVSFIVVFPRLHPSLRHTNRSTGNKVINTNYTRHDSSNSYDFLSFVTQTRVV